MAIIGALPVNLTNGTQGDATQVMSDFNFIVSQVNSNAAAAGANSDITSLTGLTTPLAVVEGGTGLATITAHDVLVGAGTSAIVPITPSTAGKVLTSNGTGADPSFQDPASQAGRLIGQQIFTTPGTATYTPTAGTTSVVVQVLAAGGGGGGCALTGASQFAVGAGGGPGGFAQARLLSGFSGVTVTVGAKGTGGSAGANNGTAGGNSSFGSAVVATGGSAGSGGGAGNAPGLSGTPGGSGVGTAGDLLFGGRVGMFGFALASTAFGVMSANGGSSIWGEGGTSFIAATGAAGNNANGVGYGGGGGGGMNIASQGTGKAGGNGSPGIVIVWEYS